MSYKTECGWGRIANFIVLKKKQEFFMEAQMFYCCFSVAEVPRLYVYSLRRILIYSKTREMTS